MLLQFGFFGWGLARDLLATVDNLRRAIVSVPEGKSADPAVQQLVSGVEATERALLETEAQTENVAIRCGFGSLRRMDGAFSRAISATPTEFRARFKAPGAPG